MKEEIKKVVVDLDILSKDVVQLDFGKIGVYTIPVYPSMAGLIFLEKQNEKVMSAETMGKQAEILTDTLVYIINTGKEKQDEAKLKELILNNSNPLIVQTIVNTYYKQATSFFLNEKSKLKEKEVSEGK